MNEKSPQFGGSVNTSKVGKPDANFVEAIAREQERSSTLHDKAEILLGGNTGQGISLPDKYIRDGHRSVQPILDTLKKHNGHLHTFDEELCIQMEEKYGLSEPAMVLAIAIRLREKALNA